MYILLREKGVLGRMPLLSMYSENGRSPWESDDDNEVLLKYQQIKHTHAVWDIVGTVSKLSIDRTELCSSSGSSPPEGPDALSAIQAQLADILSAVSDLSARMEAVEQAL